VCSGRDRRRSPADHPIISNDSHIVRLMRRFRSITADDARVQDMVWLVSTILLGCLAISAACVGTLELLGIIKEHRVRQRPDPPSSRRPPAGCASLRPPLMSNER